MEGHRKQQMNGDHRADDGHHKLDTRGRHATSSHGADASMNCRLLNPTAPPSASVKPASVNIALTSAKST